MNKYNTTARIRKLVTEHFGNDKDAINRWFVTKNTSFQNISPITMMVTGREKEVLAFVEDTMLSNEFVFKKAGRK